LKETPLLLFDQCVDPVHVGFIAGIGDCDGVTFMSLPPSHFEVVEHMPEDLQFLRKFEHMSEDLTA